MATALEQAFIAAVRVAAGVKQGAYAAATTAYGGVFANLATYQAAIVAADNAYLDSVQSAATTAGISPNVVDECTNSMIYGNWASITT
jgi:hypothetical protein